MELNENANQDNYLTDIAIIGMSCRFPGSEDVKTYWSNLINGVETITHFTDQELENAGEQEELLNNPHYIKARGTLKNVEYFDANFFGFSAYDAKLLDPQQRIFLECAWEALEDAGYSSQKYDGLVGVYASMADSQYLQNNLLKNNDLLQSFDWFQARIATSITTLSTQVSYRLNLKGPSINVTTACSSSLVAIATACRALIDFDCDIAIAGAAAITIPQERGYIYQEEGINSTDGHCRAFDAKASGTVFSNGVGIVILKRLEDAIKDKDFIYATIKGWNINNDGADKVGFSAPSVKGQEKCVTSALEFANINAETISYIETHGTATMMGDPIEIRALQSSFELDTNKKQFCALGSVKTNIGHCDIAAGMASVIKVALALHHKVIPASLNYSQPNPEIDFPDTSFYVNTHLKKWLKDDLPRRAGVNSSGIGGTNAFLVMEEYEYNYSTTPENDYELLILSAKSKTSLENSIIKLINFLETDYQEDGISNIAYTLQKGRTDFDYRKFVICKNVKNDALDALKNEQVNINFINKYSINEQHPQIVFMFPGQGSQYTKMAKDLYLSETTFAQWVDHCFKFLNEEIKEEVLALLFGDDEHPIDPTDTLIVQPALFIFEYSLAQFLISLNIKPYVMIGHSIGEYVSACLAGVMELSDAIKLVSCRAELMAKTSKGRMLAVDFDEHGLSSLLEQADISIAAYNSPANIVLSGSLEEIEKIEKILNEKKIFYRRLRTDNAFHSSLMEPILKDYNAIINNIKLNPPQLNFISNVTGDWITEEEAINPDYWVNHIRNPVKFLQGLETLQKDEMNIYVEIGPGKTLCTFVKELINNKNKILIQNTLPAHNDPIKAKVQLLNSIGSLWLHGINIDWDALNKDHKCSRLPIPTYSFDRQYHWVLPDINTLDSKAQPYSKWFYEPSWERASFNLNIIENQNLSIKPYWIILTQHPLGDLLCDKLILMGQQAIKVKKGLRFEKLSSRDYVIDVTKKEDFTKLVVSINLKENIPIYVINLLSLSSQRDVTVPEFLDIEKTLYNCFYAVLFLSQVLIELKHDNDVNILFIANEMFSVIGNEIVNPAKSVAIGPCRVIPEEHSGIKIKIIDIDLSDLINAEKAHRFCDQIILEMNNQKQNENILAYRGEFRWIQTFRHLTLKTNSIPLFKKNGTYLFTGGLGGIALTLMKHIAGLDIKPKLIILTRSPFLEPRGWEDWLLQKSTDDKQSKKIILLKKIKELGAEIYFYQTDIANESELTHTINEIKSKFGVINGVLHAAGVAGGGLAQLKTIEMAKKVFSPKIYGTYFLMHYLRDEPLDFFILCSSVSSIIGEMSQIDYCAANACLDIFPYSNIFKNKNTLVSTINWNTWREVGMAVETERPTDVTYFDRNNDISPDEGAKIFFDVIANRVKQAIISKIEINSFIELINKNKYAMRTSKDLQKRTDLLEEGQNYQFPTNIIEEGLVNIWREILGIDRISISDDFFMLGGHSLMALRMLNKIENKFDVKINLSTLQESRTVKNLATVVKSTSTNKISLPSVLMPIRTTANKNFPLFCFHPVSGLALCYVSLAKYLKLDAPIYGVQDPSIGKGKLLFNSLEEMACNYVKVIKQIQSHGPYQLLGFSFGATLAVEVAKQLRADNAILKPLIFLDGWAKFSHEQHMKDVFKKALQRIDNKNSFNEQLLELCWARMNLLLNYQIPKIPEKVILLKATELLPEYKKINKSTNYWDLYTSDLEIYNIPGNHETILDEPNVRMLTNKIDEILLLYKEN